LARQGYAEIEIKIEPKVIPIEDENVRKIFPGDRFFGVYLPRWPVAIRPPKELSYETDVCIRNDKSVEPIGDEDALRTFLAHAISNVFDEKDARSALLASLRLAEAGAKNGPYEFDEPSNISVVRRERSILAIARATVRGSARGELELRMEFSDGGITPGAINISGRLRPGPPQVIIDPGAHFSR
jgi:hypothetical protein